MCCVYKFVGFGEFVAFRSSLIEVLWVVDEGGTVIGEGETDSMLVGEPRSSGDPRRSANRSSPARPCE